MALIPGARLGVYEIIAPIGEGGMGQVFRARDIKLNRDVALKVLPDSFANDADRLARFTREAQALAALNHPNIAAIYGIEESSGVRALVMELVDGDDLSQRIARGAIPLDEALPIAKQIAEALEAAHEQGVIHRDLKPANIKVRSDGAVKVLDFGLAKLSEASAANASGPAALSMSPTITSPAMMTGVGMILGTAAYMSPEQARGKAVDKRSDIWAFGCVLFEMLAGVRPFDGHETTDAIIATLSKEPDWTKVPVSIPLRMRELLQQCLKKDPRQRLRDIGDARLQLQQSEAEATVEGGTRERRTVMIAVVGLLAAVVVGGYLLLSLKGAALPPGPLASLQLIPPANRTFGSIAVSPDGRRLAFTTAGDTSHTAHLWVRSLDSLAMKEVPNTEGAAYPFWSPDSRFIGFFADHKLKKVEASGGPVQTVCELVNDRGGPVGGSWSQSGTIIFGVEPFGPEPFYRVPAAGGTPQQLRLREPSAERNHHHWPIFLPDGRHFLYFAVNNTDRDRTGLYVGSVDADDVRFIVNTDSSGVYAKGESGSNADYILFTRERTLMAQRFDADRLESVGDAAPVAEQIGIETFLQRPKLSASGNGVLVYGAGSDITQLVWFDRNGTRLGTLGPPGINIDLRVSPDGKRVAAQRQDGRGGADLWLFDVDRGTSSRLPLRAAYNLGPVWSSDGTRIVFTSIRDHWEVHEISSSGGTEESVLLKRDDDVIVDDSSPDGRYLLYREIDAQTRRTLGISSLEMRATAEASPSVFTMHAEFDENFLRFSPDGRWVAYDSSDSGRHEIYVRPFRSDRPAADAKVTISTNGGTEPRWPHGSSEIFYIGPDNMLMTVDAKTAPTFQAGVPRPLFPTRPAGVLRFDVTSDGQRFIVSTPTEEALGAPASVVLNWPALLKKQ